MCNQKRKAAGKSSFFTQRPTKSGRKQDIFLEDRGISFGQRTEILETGQTSNALLKVFLFLRVEVPQYWFSDIFVQKASHGASFEFSCEDQITHILFLEAQTRSALI